MQGVPAKEQDMKKKKKKYNACSFKICPIEVGKNGQVNRRYAN